MDWKDNDAMVEFVHRVRMLPQETEWIEFKEGLENPDEIGEYISALSNSAALQGVGVAYAVWGINDDNHEAVGTKFDPFKKKKGGEALIPWLARLLDPRIDFSFHGCVEDGKKFVVLRVPPATSTPVRFSGAEWFRISSHNKKLKDFPESLRNLWRALDSYEYEKAIALDGLGVSDIVELIDYPAFFTLTKQPLPENRSEIIDRLQASRLVQYDVENEWQITNGGALLYARRLSDFEKISRKAPRVIHYRGKSRIDTIVEQVGAKGYAAGFSGLIEFIAARVPEAEVIDSSGVRSDNLLFPRIILRELVANTLIHQDLTVSGSAPKVEIFEDRIEFTNPGTPLIPGDRFIDMQPRSRNEFLAEGMRMAHLAEERGSGWDKVTFQIELHQLPPAQIEVEDAMTRVSIFAHRELSKMDREERVLAVYQHACLQYVTRESTNNASIRKRFNIAERNKARATQLLNEAVEDGKIVVYDPTVGPRSRRYVPTWAAPARAAAKGERE